MALRGQVFAGNRGPGPRPYIHINSKTIYYEKSVYHNYNAMDDLSYEPVCYSRSQWLRQKR
jgi:hypothetical protein